MAGIVAAIVVYALGVGAGAGLIYGWFTTRAARRLMAQPAAAERAPWPRVDILKPLHGDEPGLADNLASFVAQDYPARFSMVCGVADAGDPAAIAVARVTATHPGMEIRLVVDPRQHGPNRKISNLINIDSLALSGPSPGEVVILADSDIRVGPDYLRRVVSALLQPGVGAVSCLYRGQPAAGFWSRLSALGIDAHFLPGAGLGIVYGLARPCFGSTIAVKREVLAETGGLPALAYKLADDHALGEAVRATGRAVVFPPMVVAHLCAEQRFMDLWRHDLRWARTIRALNPGGYLGSVITYPIGLAVLAAAIAGFSIPALAFLAATIVLRLAIHARLQRLFGLPRAGLMLLPLREILSLAVFLWSFTGRSVDWRGERLDIATEASLARKSEGTR